MYWSQRPQRLYTESTTAGMGQVLVSQSYVGLCGRMNKSLQSETPLIVGVCVCVDERLLVSTVALSEPLVIQHVATCEGQVMAIVKTSLLNMVRHLSGYLVRD